MTSKLILFIDRAEFFEKKILVSSSKTNKELYPSVFEYLSKKEEQK